MAFPKDWKWETDDEADLVRAERRLNEIRYRAPERVKDMVASLEWWIARMKALKARLTERTL